MNEKEFPSCAYDVCAEFDCEETMALALIATRNKLEHTRKDLSDKIGKLKTELDRTRKALDVAKGALKELRPAEKKSCYLVPTVSTTQRIIDEALEQITALEQKDK